MSRIERMQEERRRAAETAEQKNNEAMKKFLDSEREKQEAEEQKQLAADQIASRLGVRELVKEANRDAKKTLKRSYTVDSDGLGLHDEFGNPGSYSHDWQDPGTTVVSVAGVSITPTENGQAEIIAGGSTHIIFDGSNREEVREVIAEALAQALLSYSRSDHDPESNRWTH